MAAFDPGDDAEEMPDIKWVDGFQRSEDAAWWSKGDHVGLGKDLVRSSLRALAPDLPTPSAGDLGLANNMVDGCIPIAFTGIEDKDSGFRLKAGADGTDFTTLEELDTLSHQFFTQDRTKDYPPILRAQSGGPAVEPKYRKAREENYKRRARGEPELPYWTHKDISRATECVFWTSHSVLFKFNLDEDGYELDSLDYGPCEYETRRGTVVEYDLEPGVTLPNLFSDGYPHPYYNTYNASDTWYQPEESYNPDEGLIRVFKAGGNSCDEDLDGWYEPKVIIDVRIPTRVCSVDLHRYAIAADQLVNQAELADELVVNYQRQLAHAEKEVRIYKEIARKHLEYGIRYRGDLEELRTTHADTVVKKANLHRLCRDLVPRSFREVKDVTLGFILWGVNLLLSNHSLARSNKQDRDRIKELEDQLAALGIQESEERNSKKQRTNLLGISDGHRWTEATTKDLKAIAGIKPEERLAALENLQDTADCQEELSRQFTVRQKEFPELPEQFK